MHVFIALDENCLFLNIHDRRNDWFMMQFCACLFITLLFAGSPALTSRGMKEAEMHIVADFMDQAIQLTIEAQKKTSKLEELLLYKLCFRSNPLFTNICIFYKDNISHVYGTIYKILQFYELRSIGWLVGWLID